MPTPCVHPCCTELTRVHPTAAEGVELVGLRGCRAIRNALGVAGVRALDRLLEARMIDGLQQLSTALMAAQPGKQFLICFAAQEQDHGRQLVPYMSRHYGTLHSSILQSLCAAASFEP